jgi:hypothetical protein
MPRRIPTDNYHTLKDKHSWTTTQKHTSQQKHNTMTSLKGIVSTMARTPAKGSTPPSSTPPKRNKRKGNNDISNKRKSKVTNNDTKSKEALIDTSSETGTVTVNPTVHNVNNNVATRTADPDSSDNARHGKQQQMRQSMGTTEGDKSNAEDSKTTQENNNNTPVLGSTVSKITIFSILENIAYTTYLI